MWQINNIKPPPFYLPTCKKWRPPLKKKKERTTAHSASFPAQASRPWWAMCEPWNTCKWSKFISCKREPRATPHTRKLVTFSKWRKTLPLSWIILPKDPTIMMTLEVNSCVLYIFVCRYIVLVVCVFGRYYMGGDIGHLGTALWLVGHDHMGETRRCKENNLVGTDQRNTNCCFFRHKCNKKSTFIRTCIKRW